MGSSLSCTLDAITWSALTVIVSSALAAQRSMLMESLTVLTIVLMKIGRLRLRKMGGVRLRKSPLLLVAEVVLLFVKGVLPTEDGLTLASYPVEEKGEWRAPGGDGVGITLEEEDLLLLLV